MRTYRATGSVPLPAIEVGDTFAHAFTAEAEAELVAAGRIEILPRAYRNVGSRRVFEVDPGGRFEAALSLAQEGQLVAAGHIEPVEAKKQTKPEGSKADAEPALKAEKEKTN